MKYILKNKEIELTDEEVKDIIRQNQIKKEKIFEIKELSKIQIGDWVYFKEWWDKKGVIARVIEAKEGVATTHFRLYFPDKELEQENNNDKEWFRLKHIDNIYRIINK
jgi:hypothetical protein